MFLPSIASTFVFLSVGTLAPSPSLAGTSTRAVAGASEATAAGAAIDEQQVEDAIERSVEILLERQESLDENEVLAEWPYEGVYREGGQIPIGYRVGGTSIAAWSLVEAPEYRDSKKVRTAVRRALEFVLRALDEEAMDIGFSRGYDVRGWGISTP